MCKEYWVKCDMFSNLSETYSIHTIFDKDGKLQIILESTAKNCNEKKLITFQNVLFYRSMSESLWCFLSEISDDVDGNSVLQHTLFRIINSSLIRQLEEEDEFENNKDDLVHFVLVGTDDFVDVITTSEPFFVGISHVK